MKNKHLLEQALAELSNEYGTPAKMIDRARLFIVQFLASQTAANIGKFDLSAFASKDKTGSALRPVLTGIYNDPRRLQGCNRCTHLMCGPI